VPSSRWFVDGDYHALHHAFPDHFVSAHVTVVDVVLGRMLPLEGRAVVLTGGSRLVADLQHELERAGARVVRVDEDQLDDALLASASVLVLGHGAARRDDVAYEAFVARARRLRSEHPWPDHAPLDVWAIGDDVAWLARAPLLHGDDVGLRLLVHAPALGAARTLASLRRGARVV